MKRLLNKGQTLCQFDLKFLSAKYIQENATFCATFFNLILGTTLSVGNREYTLSFLLCQNQDLVFQIGKAHKEPSRKPEDVFQGAFTKLAATQWHHFLLLPPRLLALQRAMWSHLAALPAATASTSPTKEVLFHSRWCIKIPEKVLYGKGIINPSMSAGSEMVTAQISNSTSGIWRHHLLWSISPIAYWARARHKGKAVELMKSKELFSINNA